MPFELRIHDNDSGPQEVGTLEAIRVKFLLMVIFRIYPLQGSEHEPQGYRVELTSENDLFFHYTVQYFPLITDRVDEQYFNELQANQKLTIEFNEFQGILIKMLNSCLREPHSFLAVFVMQRDGRATLDFIQNIEYKFVELLSLEFGASTEDIIRQQITFRYNSVKSKLALMQARLQDVNKMVKVKSPSLLLQMQQKQHSQSKGQSVMKSRTNMWTSLYKFDYSNICIIIKNLNINGFLKTWILFSLRLPIGRWGVPNLRGRRSRIAETTGGRTSKHGLRAWRWWPIRARVKLLYFQLITGQFQ